MKFFIWFDVLTDYTSGVMGCIAPDVETARKILKKECDYIPKGDLEKDPEVWSLKKAKGFAVWGGG